jgi:hypothetical protein
MTVSEKTLWVIPPLPSETFTVIDALPCAFVFGAILRKQEVADPVTESPDGATKAGSELNGFTEDAHDRTLSTSEIVNGIATGVSSSVDLSAIALTTGASLTGRTLRTNTLDAESKPSVPVTVTLVVPYAFADGWNVAWQLGHVPLQTTALVADRSPGFERP